MPIVPARLEYAGGVPYSSLYDDIYHPVAGAVGQSRAVFLHGCGLPEAWAGRASYVILETGFGAGLNFLCAWAAWRDDPARPARLHFLSVEKHPFTARDLATLHAAWPEFSALSAELLANWPQLMPGFHRIALDQGRVQLSLMLGEVADCVAQLDATVDAIYLDGFAPDRNPDMWQPRVFKELARLARPGARLASYSVAASVRAGLASAGFVCEKCAGYGHKRHRLEAQFSGPYAHKSQGRSRPETLDTPRHIDRAAAVETPQYVDRAAAVEPPRHVAIIGAGVAGCAVAYALAARGIRVSVLDAAAAPAQGASGNPAGVFRPLPSVDDNRASRLTRAAFLYNLAAWSALGDAVNWSRCGVLQFARDAAHLQKLAKTLAANAAPPEFARWVDAAEAAQLAGWPLAEAAVYYPNAGWIDPASLCRAWLADPAIEFLPQRRVAALHPQDNGWQVRAVDGETLIEADAVVVANAYDASQLLPLARLQRIRGQINIVPGAALPGVRTVIAREGYLSPSPSGDYVVGASYEYDADPDAALVPGERGDADNWRRLHAILPGYAAGGMAGRVSVRAVMPDRFPLLGQVQPGLLVAAAYASRGVVWAGLLGETLASLICDEPRPIERDLLHAMNPLRSMALS